MSDAGAPQSARRKTSGSSATGSLYDNDVEVRDNLMRNSKQKMEGDVLPSGRGDRTYSDCPAVLFPSPNKDSSSLSLCFSPPETRAIGLPLEIGCEWILSISNLFVH